MPAAFLNNLLGARRGEATTAWMMFAYSFLAMTSYNIVKPLARGEAVEQFGTQWVPVIMLAAVVFIGVVMEVYSGVAARLSARSVVPVTLGGLGVLMLAFRLLLPTGAAWVPIALYVFGLVFGILVISQFWTIANDIYDSRQARRLFGFIGGGASLGGVLGNAITGYFQAQIGKNNLLLVSTAVLGLCMVLVVAILRRASVTADLAGAGEERGVGGREALGLLRESRHLQLIALVIGCAALAATVGELQLYKVAEVSRSNSVSAFLGKVGFYVSIVGFIVQVGLTRVIHRSLGLAVALLILPFGLGTTALIILTMSATWAPAVGSVFDRSIRYTLDKTTREVLFLPLSSDLKRRAKPFVDVTVDRFGKAMGALLILAINPPGRPPIAWQSLSYVILGVLGVWIAGALVARREYLRSFRRSLVLKEIEPASVRVTVADAATIGALVEELAAEDERSVLYAIEMLEMLDRHQLMTPLLLQHTSPAVRTRALHAVESFRATDAERWKPAVTRLVHDPDAEVRAAAVRALATLAREDAPAMLRRFLDDPNPGAAASAAAVLADSADPADPPAAFETLKAMVSDDRAQAAPARLQAAAALGRIRNPDMRALLVLLMDDPDAGVAREAIRSASRVGAGDARFVPALVSLLGHRVLKAPARETLVSFGEAAIVPLAFFLRDQGEHVWVRRHVPATLAGLPCQASMDALLGALDDPDGFLRFKIIEAIETLKRDHPALVLPPSGIESLVLKETARYLNYLTLRFNLLRHDDDAGGTLLVRALDDKLDRALDRVYRLLGLLHSWRDIAAVRQSLKDSDPRRRARAVEYLDNLLHGAIRRRVLAIVEDRPLDDKVRVANDILRTRPRDLDDTLAQLVHEPDPVVSASAIEFVVRRRRWTLANDLTFAETKRPEHLVADAAAWALRSRAPEAGGGDADGAPLPVVAIADRLRSIRLFDFVSVDELFRIAVTGRQVRCEAGHVLYEQGQPVADVHFLIGGAVDVNGSGPVVSVAAPAALAFEDMLEGRPIRHTVTTARPTISLSLDSSALLTMVSDNIELARGLFQMLLTSGSGTAADVAVDGPAAAPAASGTRPLEPVEKARLLRRSPILSRATVNQLMDLVAITRDVELVEGAVLGEDAPEAPVIYHVVSGEVAIDRTDAGAVLVGPGGTIGLRETLAGLPMPGRIRVTRAGFALRLDQAPLFEVLSDHVDLLQGLFSGVLHLGRRPQ